MEKDVCGPERPVDESGAGVSGLRADLAGSPRIRAPSSPGSYASADSALSPVRLEKRVVFLEEELANANLRIRELERQLRDASLTEKQADGLEEVSVHGISDTDVLHVTAALREKLRGTSLDSPRFKAKGKKAMLENIEDSNMFIDSVMREAHELLVKRSSTGDSLRSIRELLFDLLMDIAETRKRLNYESEAKIIVGKKSSKRFQKFNEGFIAMDDKRKHREEKIKRRSWSAGSASEDGPDTQPGSGARRASETSAKRAEGSRGFFWRRQKLGSPTRKEKSWSYQARSRNGARPVIELSDDEESPASREGHLADPPWTVFTEDEF